MGDHVYNPFDILLFLRGNKQFESYWFETATPTFLIKLLKQKQFFFPVLSNIKAGKELLTSFDIDKIGPVTLLFQTGYLTIKEGVAPGNCNPVYFRVSKFGNIYRIYQFLA